MLLRDVPFSIIYWFGYEYLKLKLNSMLDPSYYPLVPFVSGSLAGSVSAVLTNPLDVAKTHMQVYYYYNILSISCLPIQFLWEIGR